MNSVRGFADTATAGCLPLITFYASFHLVTLSLSTFPHLIHADDGVSIPCSYTSYLAPLSSSKLYNEVRGCRERDKDPECHFETPYVVRLHNFHQLAEPKACFTFKHPTTGRTTSVIPPAPRNTWAAYFSTNSPVCFNHFFFCPLFQT